MSINICPERVNYKGNLMANNWVIGTIVLIVIILIGAYLLASGSSPSSTSTTSSYTATGSNGSTQSTTSTGTSGSESSAYPVMMTDPATTPPGTQALVVSYSNVKLRQAGTDSYVSATMNGQASGSVNVLNLTGNTQTIASYQNSANASFDQVVFTITSAQTTINGTTYSVPVSNSQVTANITGTANGGAVVQFSPVLVQLYNGPGKFTLVSSARAGAVSKQTVNSSGTAAVGTVTALNSAETASLNTGASLSLDSVSTYTVSNQTMVNATVTNNGNTSIVITNLVLNGAAREAPASSINSTVGLNASVNASLLGILGAGVNVQVVAQQAAQFQADYHNQLNFVVSSDGSLQVPSTQAQASASGYVLAPGKSATLTFNGAANLGSTGRVAILIPNESYMASTVANEGLTSSTTTTAKAG